MCCLLWFCFWMIPISINEHYNSGIVLYSNMYFTCHFQMLVLSGGAYGERIAKICSCLSIPHDVLRNPENSIIDLEEVASALSNNKYSNVAAVHSETSSGVINPVVELGQLIKQHQPGEQPNLGFVFARD